MKKKNSKEKFDERREEAIKLIEQWIKEEEERIKNMEEEEKINGEDTKSD